MLGSLVTATCLSLLLAQASPTGSVLASRGQFLLQGWDGTKRTAARLNESLAALEEISTEGDGALKFKLGGGLLVVVGPSSKLVLEKYEEGADPTWHLKVAYGRVRVVADNQRVRLGAAMVATAFQTGEVVLISEGGKAQVVALSGTVAASSVAATGKSLNLTQGLAADFTANGASTAYGIKDKTQQDLRVSLDLDETPLVEIAQALETDLPGFVGPQAGRIRWKGVSEGYGEGGVTKQPFNQTPVLAAPTAAAVAR